MKYFIYFQLNESNKIECWEPSFVDMSELNIVHRDKEKIVIKTEKANFGFEIGDIIEVVTNHKRLARFIRNAGIDVDFEEDKE